MSAPRTEPATSTPSRSMSASAATATAAGSARVELGCHTCDLFEKILLEKVSDKLVLLQQLPVLKKLHCKSCAFV